MKKFNVGCRLSDKRVKERWAENHRLEGKGKSRVGNSRKKKRGKKKEENVGDLNL